MTVATAFSVKREYWNFPCFETCLNSAGSVKLLVLFKVCVLLWNIDIDAGFLPLCFPSLLVSASPCSSLVFLSIRLQLKFLLLVTSIILIFSSLPLTVKVVWMANLEILA